jgi:cytochrome c553
MMRTSILIIALSFFIGATAFAADIAAGKQKAEQVCAACHGANGISATGDFPKLAGQYNLYLVRALKDYKSGARTR